MFDVTERDQTYTTAKRELGGHKVLTELQADSRAACGGVSDKAEHTRPD